MPANVYLYCTCHVLYFIQGLVLYVYSFLTLKASETGILRQEQSLSDWVLILCRQWWLSDWWPHFRLFICKFPVHMVLRRLDDLSVLGCEHLSRIWTDERELFLNQFSIPYTVFCACLERKKLGTHRLAATWWINGGGGIYSQVLTCFPASQVQ